MNESYQGTCFSHLFLCLIFMFGYVLPLKTFLWDTVVHFKCLKVICIMRFLPSVVVSRVFQECFEVIGEVIHKILLSGFCFLLS